VTDVRRESRHLTLVIEVMRIFVGAFSARDSCRRPMPIVQLVDKLTRKIAKINPAYNHKFLNCSTTRGFGVFKIYDGVI
jgi:hypothetical protein